MSGDLDLEQRYRRVLRLLPGYYRDKWEEDMVAAFLDSWLTGDPDEDSVTMEYDRPTRQEIASVVALAFGTICTVSWTFSVDRTLLLRLMVARTALASGGVGASSRLASAFSTTLSSRVASGS